ncbi:unnamed protein product, partial [Porites lobata]
ENARDARVWHIKKVNEQRGKEVCRNLPFFTPEKPLVSLFHGKPGLGLNPLRYQRYFENLAAKTSLIEPQNLYPTAEAARFHSLRIYLQVKQWQGERCWHVNGELEVESH